MRRVHAIELEDQPWLPATLRDLTTHTLQHMNDALGVYDAAVPVLARVLETQGLTRIVDLCSGAGGPWRRIAPMLAKTVPTLDVTLTDLYPHAAPPGRAAHLTYRTEPVNATAVPGELVGVRTMFSGFHHFTPDRAVAVLASATRERMPIAIFEFTRRRWRNVALAVIAGGLGLLLVAPWLRPFRLTHLLWAYLVPVGALVYAWDGAISNLRSYTPEELLALARRAAPTGYTWEAGELAPPGQKLPLTYLVGQPT